MELLVQERDIPRTMALMGQFVTEEPPEGEEPPCPCCGTAAPLVRGACSDCGLQLA
jgi:predicted amidophosphoribosyltransferase